MKRRAQWFVPLDRTYFAMWWVPIGIVPTLAEALDHLVRLRRNSPSSDAFSWSDLRGERNWDQA